MTDVFREGCEFGSDLKLALVQRLKVAAGRANLFFDDIAQIPSAQSRRVVRNPGVELPFPFFQCSEGVVFVHKSAVEDRLLRLGGSI